MKIVYGLLILACVCITSSYGGRGDKWKFLNPSSEIKKPDPEPVIRRPRHHKWKLNEIDEEDDHETTTTPKPSPITKSAEQIKAEVEAERRRVNPKGFLMGGNIEKNKAIKKMFGTDGSIDKKVKEMEEKIKSLQSNCLINADCTNQTCCLVNSQGIGKCILQPHKIGQECTDMCSCANDLECKWKETDQVKPGEIKNVKKCSKKALSEDSKEFEEELISKLRNAVQKTKGCSSCRNA